MNLGEVTRYEMDTAQLLVGHNVQRMDDDETTVQPATVRAHVKDTYLPGDRQIPSSPEESQHVPHRRQAPRRNGFACAVEGCNKAYDRNCELK